MTRTSDVPDKYAPVVKVRQFRKGDKMVTVTTKVTPAVIDFNDILAACKVEEDLDRPAPWEDMDGWEHEEYRLSRIEDDGGWGHAEEVYPDGASKPTYRWVCHYNKDDVVSVGHYDQRLVVVSFDRAGEWLGGPAPGEHRQVYWERLAESRRRNLEQLKRWYRDGWVYYAVVCEFLGRFAGTGGIQTKDDSPSDPYLDDCKEDVALEVADELGKDGYTVVNRPDRKTRQARRDLALSYLRFRIARNLGFQGPEEYQAWLRK